MFDTMTFTKVVGAFCGSLLVFMLGGWASELIYHGAGGHKDGEHQQAYVIDTGEEEGGDTEAEAGPTFAELFAAADAGKGERVYNQCRACHALEQGSNGVGPYLYGVVGRDVGAADGYAYSGALSEAADVWTPQELNAFLENPAGYAPGTSMGYSGLRKAEDRANVIAYLDQTDGDVTVIEASAPADAAPAEEAAEETQMEEAAAEQVTAEEPVVAEVEATPEAEAVAEEATEETAAATEEAAEETAAATEEAVTESGFAALVAAADPAAGQRVYRQCQACHVPDQEQNRVGPHMVGLVGREIGSVDGFRYSDALSGMDGVWDYDALNAWLEDPKAFAPGNKMSYRGLSDEEDRAAVIAYIESVQP
jgi:cytochrome c